MTDEAFFMNCQKDHKPLYCFYFCHQKLACLPFFFLLLVPFEYSSSESYIKKDYAKISWICLPGMILNHSKKIGSSTFLLEVQIKMK